MHQILNTIIQKTLTAIGTKAAIAYGRKRGWKHIEKEDQEKRKWEHQHMYDSDWMKIKRKLPQIFFYIAVIIAFILWTNYGGL